MNQKINWYEVLFIVFLTIPFLIVIKEYHGWQPSKHPTCAYEWEIDPISNFCQQDLLKFFKN